MVRITMEDGGIIDIELNEEAAPITCENFKKLVSEGFYNGLTFHRVIPGFMIQGGCPLGNGTGGPGWNIKGEFAANGVNNPLKHTRGVISMARAMNPNSAGSQFFIMHQDAPHLDGQYAAFGKVVAGMDVVDKIAAVRTDWNDKPTTPVKMKTVELIEGLNTEGGTDHRSLSKSKTGWLWCHCHGWPSGGRKNYLGRGTGCDSGRRRGTHG